MELDKINEEYGTLSEFAGWLFNHKELIVSERIYTQSLVPTIRSSVSVVHEYLGIDTAKLERERRELLSSLRSG